MSMLRHLVSFVGCTQQFQENSIIAPTFPRTAVRMWESNVTNFVEAAELSLIVKSVLAQNVK